MRIPAPYIKTDNRRMELVMASILRLGLLAAAVIVVCGAAVYLSRHGSEQPQYRVFRSVAEEYRSVPGILEQVSEGRGRGLIMLGLGLLLLTPVARVFFALLAFARQRDRTYAVVTLIVLIVLIFSLTGG